MNPGYWNAIYTNFLKEISGSLSFPLERSRCRQFSDYKIPSLVEDARQGIYPDTDLFDTDNERSRSYIL